MKGISMKPFLVVWLTLTIGILPVSALAETISVPANTIIPIVTNQHVSAQHTQQGDPLSFMVNENVVIGGKTVFKQGDPVIVYVEKAKKAGAWGRGGYLTLKGAKVKAVEGTEFPLTFSYQVDGEDKASGIALPIASLVVLWPLAFFAFKKGENATIPPGKTLNTFTSTTNTITLP